MMPERTEVVFYVSVLCVGLVSVRAMEGALGDQCDRPSRRLTSSYDPYRYCTWVVCECCRCCYKTSSTFVLCEGHNITDIPGGLPENATHVTFHDTAIVNFTAEHYYNKEHGVFGSRSKLIGQKQLQVLSFRRNCKLANFDLGAFQFEGRTSLTHISIQGSPLLEHIPNGVLGSFSRLQNLAITDCGLKTPPGWMVFSNGGEHLVKLDLSGNKFRVLSNESFDGLEMGIGTLVLENTPLEEINEAPFYRTKIAHIQLGKNPSLKKLSETAFLQTQDILQYLDLSESQIDSLPIAGLHTLTELVLENIWSLKMFPPVLYFWSIKKASLTYHHHCCAFKFPRKQYQDESQWIQFKDTVTEDCAAKRRVLPTPPTPSQRPLVSGSLSADGLMTHTTSIPRGPGGPDGAWGAPPAGGLGFQGREERTGFEDSWAAQPHDVFGAPFPTDGDKAGALNGAWHYQPVDHGDSLDQLGMDPSSSGPRRRQPGQKALTAQSRFNDRIGRGHRWPSRNNEQPARGTRLGGVKEKVMHGESWDLTTLDPNQTHLYKEECGINGSVEEWSKNVVCTPERDAFNPCEDIMRFPGLRGTAWLVVATSLIGNIVVLMVTVFSKYKLTVAKFLMCNLAFADLTLGMYLFLLTAFDLHSLGVYFTYAIPWQYEGGCQAAGFLAIFSTCLSIFSLTAITMERWYAISHAIHLTKRLRLRQASAVMVCGWVFALIMAMLPLVGVSNYSKTAICLPMAVNNPLDKGYVISLLLLNAVAFFVIAWCYVDMYRKVRSKDTCVGRNDVSIAKRMALLVITDFACLFPIAFFGLTAACGYELISIPDSKILLVFFFPLNSCCNPFLYAMFTKQFKKDLFGMLSRCGLCEKRAAKYRMTFMYTSNPMSMSHSRHSNPHLITNRVDQQHLANLASRGLRASDEYNKSPNATPVTTPTECPTEGVDDNLPNFKEISINDSDYDTPIVAEKNRKLSVVPESIAIPEDGRKLPREEPISDDLERRYSDPPIAKTVRSASQYNNAIQGKNSARGDPGPDFDRRKVSQSTMLTLLSSNTDISCVEASLTSGESLDAVDVRVERDMAGAEDDRNSIEKTPIHKKNGLVYEALSTVDSGVVTAHGQRHNKCSEQFNCDS